MISRREILTKIGKGALVLGAGAVSGGLSQPGRVEASGPADKLTEAQVRWIQIVSACDPDGSKMLALMGICVATQPRISCEHVTDETLSRKVVFEGFPAHATSVLNTSMDSRFKATWSIDSGLNMGLAEPGMLANPNRFEKIDSIPYTIRTGLQGFTFVVFQEGILEWAGMDGRPRKVELPEKHGRTHGVLIRERYNTNGNKPFDIKVTCGVKDHGQVQHFDAGAFVSESQMGQVSLAVFTGKNLDGTQNDNTANDQFTLTIIDENTGGHTVATQSGMGQPFVGEDGSRNW